MSRELVKRYLDAGLRIVTWPQVADAKGPYLKEWQLKTYTLDDYREGQRVGLITGHEVEPGKFLVDVDIDYAPGSAIAQSLIPPTDFIYGRASKRISHCFYTVDEPCVSMRYEDIDKSCLIELRGTKIDGSLGCQSMAPPSIWTKDGKAEPLAFVRQGLPAHIPHSATLRRRVALAAIGMILAKHFGRHGFGHEVRLAWAGFLLRAGLAEAELIAMGEAISVYCNNRELSDVSTVVESTAKALAKDGKKVKGRPTLAKLLGPSGNKIVARIQEWLGHEQDFIRNKDGVIVKDSQENIRRAVQVLDITLANDEFAERMLIREGQGPTRHLEDAPVEELWLRIDREFGFRPTPSFFHVVINSLARENTFHPVRDYLSALKWDGEPRINTWLAVYGGAEDVTKSDADDSLSYLEAVSAISLMAAVKRIYEPGCKYDEMLVAESQQGLHKSSALRALCPNEAWFSDDLALNIDSKELIECSLGKWIIEASDLSGKRKTEIEKLKAMMSRQIDGPARMAYARKPVERPRHFILIGTTNSEAYLNDPTGARRFWPVKVKKFDVPGIIRDRDQLWAEAVVRVERGESIRMPEALWQAAGEHQEARREIDPWEEPLRQALLAINPGGDGRRRVHTATLFGAVGLDPTRRDRAAALRVSQIMQRFRLTRTNVRVDGVVATGYIGQDNGDLALTLKDTDEGAGHGAGHGAGEGAGADVDTGTRITEWP